MAGEPIRSSSTVKFTGPVSRRQERQRRVGLAPRGGLTSDENTAESQYHPPARGGPAEVHLWTEAGEQHHSVQLVLHALVERAADDSVFEHLALGVHRGLDQQPMRFIGIRTLLQSGEGKSRQSLHPARLQTLAGYPLPGLEDVA